MSVAWKLCTILSTSSSIITCKCHSFIGICFSYHFAWSWLASFVVIDIVSYHLASSLFANFVESFQIILHDLCLWIMCNFIDIFSYYLYDYYLQTLCLLELLVLVSCLFPNAWMCKLVHLSFYLLVLVCDLLPNALRCKLIHSSSYGSCIQQHWTWLW
jgi:hypothetical protein